MSWSGCRAMASLFEAHFKYKALKKQQIFLSVSRFDRWSNLKGKQVKLFGGGGQGVGCAYRVALTTINNSIVQPIQLSLAISPGIFAF